MRDLSEQLATYIDSIADPVTREEIATMHAEPRRPRRAVAAALAGAAVVLIPAILLAALRWLPAEEEVTAAPSATSVPVETAPTPTTSPGVTEPSITLPSEFIDIPDLLGLRLTDAEAVVEGLGLRLAVNGVVTDGVVVVAQDPAPIYGVPEGTLVTVDIGPGWSCADAVRQPQAAPDDVGFVAAPLLFQCGDGSDVPDVSYPVIRYVPPDWEPVGATLRELVAGPTQSERTAGLQSFFTADTADAVDELRIEGGGLVIVDFNESVYVNNASTSTGSVYFLAELNTNLFRFPQVERIEYRVNGTCEAFWNWLQSDCRIVERSQADNVASFIAPCSGFGYVDHVEYADDPEVVETQTLLETSARGCRVAPLDGLALEHGTTLTFGNYPHGLTPITDIETKVIDRPSEGPTYHILDAFSRAYDVYQDEAGRDVYVWPDVASPNLDWSSLTQEEIDRLSRIYGEAVIGDSVTLEWWAGWRLEIDDTGDWRFLGVGLT